MAVLQITEFSALYTDSRGVILPIGKMPPVASQAVTFSTSAPSAAFRPGTKFVRLIADATAHVAFGESPTATADSLWMPPDTPEYFAVDGGGKVAAYDGSS